MQIQGSHSTGKMGKMVKSKSRQGKDREVENFGKIQGKQGNWKILR